MEWIMTTDVFCDSCSYGESDSREKKQRICWVRPILLRRDQVGEYHTLVQEMRTSDPAAHQRYFRMSVDDFDELLDMVNEKILKQQTAMRDPSWSCPRPAATSIAQYL